MTEAPESKNQSPDVDAGDDARSQPARRDGGPGAADPGQQVRAVMFEKNLDGHPLSLDELGALGELSDDQLLWIDVRGSPGDLPEPVLRYGIEARCMRPSDSGLITNGGDWIYLHARALNTPRSRRFTEEGLVVAFGINVVVTAHHGAIDFLRIALDEAGQLRVGSLQAGSFAASLLDRMLTDYLDARDEFETAVDRIEVLVLDRPRSRHVAELQQLRRQASKLRRCLAIQRDMFDALARPDFDPGQLPEVARHWQSLSARYSKTMTSVESARELVNGSFDVYTSRVAHGTNEAMRLLTVVTVILGTLAVVAGALGMNFETDFFATGDAGFWWTIGAMAAFSIIAVIVAIVVLDRKR